MLPLKMIFIDRRHCINESRNNSDCTNSLTDNITLPPNTTSYISDLLQSLSAGTPLKLEDMTLYTLESCHLLTILSAFILNAPSLKEATTLLRFFNSICDVRHAY